MKVKEAVAMLDVVAEQDKLTQLAGVGEVHMMRDSRFYKLKPSKFWRYMYIPSVEQWYEWRMPGRWELIGGLPDRSVGEDAEDFRRGEANYENT